MSQRRSDSGQSLAAPTRRSIRRSRVRCATHRPCPPPAPSEAVQRPGWQTPRSRRSTLVSKTALKRCTHLRSSACRISYSSGTTSSACSCVAIRTTGGAAPASAASSQRAAHRHQRSPDTSPGNMELGSRCAEVVAVLARKLEELCRHAGADRVRADILRAGMAVAVAEEPGGGILATRCEWSAEHIARRRRPISIAHRSVARRRARPGAAVASIQVVS